MQIKIHESYRKIVALSDKELLGKTFEEGNKNIEVKPGFFEGEVKDKEEIVQLLQDMAREDATFNIVGEKSVDVALEVGIISKEGVIEIDGVPVALVLM